MKAAIHLPRDFEDLISAIGTGRMGEVLLRSASRRSNVKEVFVYRREVGRRPVQVVSCGTTGSSLARAELYSGTFHTIDPAPVMLRPSRNQMVHFARIPAALISDPSYRRECFARPGLAEKLTFQQARMGAHTVLNFYAGRTLTPAEVDGLHELAEMALPILARHAELIRDTAEESLSDKLERRLQESYPELTARERQVCASTLRGKTAEAIAIDLNIAPSTVLTYRRRAYERCAISSAAQMLDRLLV